MKKDIILTNNKAYEKMDLTKDIKLKVNNTAKLKKDKEDKKRQKEKFKEEKRLVKLEKKKVVAVCERKFDNTKYGALLKRYFAHRGVHTTYPENSIPAFNEAIKLNMSIELDVHLTKDGKLVVFHDDYLARMTGVENYVRFLTLDELKQIKLKGSEYFIPSLQDVLNLVCGRVGILIEIKTEANTKKICKRLIEELKEYKGDIFIQSFNPFALRKFYKLAPQYLRGQLSSYFKNDTLGFFKKILIKGLKLNSFAHVDFVAYNIENLPNKFVNKTNVPILTWTVSTKEQFVKAKTVSNNLIIDKIDVLDF